MHQSPAATHQCETLIKKSRFIARAGLSEDRQQAMRFLDAMRGDYPDASHHCWAYVLGCSDSSSSAAMSDDGEPSGTAGKPILNVLQHKAIGDVMVVVARYFGGVKLGAGGLSRAYSAAAQAVLSELPLQTHIEMVQLRIVVDFSMEQDLRHWLQQHGGEVSDVDYQEKVSLDISLPAQDQEALVASAAERGWQILSSAR